MAQCIHLPERPYTKFRDDRIGRAVGEHGVPYLKRDPRLVGPRPVQRRLFSIDPDELPAHPQLGRPAVSAVIQESIRVDQDARVIIVHLDDLTHVPGPRMVGSTEHRKVIPPVPVHVQMDQELRQQAQRQSIPERYREFHRDAGGAGSFEVGFVSRGVNVGRGTFRSSLSAGLFGGYREQIERVDAGRGRAAVGQFHRVVRDVVVVVRRATVRRVARRSGGGGGEGEGQLRPGGGGIRRPTRHHVPRQSDGARRGVRIDIPPVARKQHVSVEFVDAQRRGAPPGLARVHAVQRHVDGRHGEDDVDQRVGAGRYQQSVHGISPKVVHLHVYVDGLGVALLLQAKFGAEG
mmetsp:Transcript_24751/g.72480  ORF Transcript_24751/g.72480 Transcript_24751/m.72480 type:complete len:348 (+) Transcript_24751:481-1524(+)